MRGSGPALRLRAGLLGWGRTATLTLVVAAEAEARACVCYGFPDVVGTSPSDGAVDVPLNTRVRVLVHNGAVGTEPALECDGLPVELEPWTDEHNGFQQLLESSPTEPLEADVSCILLLGETEILQFYTGRDTDTTSPTWEGTVSVEDHIDRQDDSCGLWQNLFLITPEGVSDDLTADEDLFFTLLPQGEGEKVWGYPSTLFVASGDKCIDMDPTLGKNPHRTYRMEAWDLAGNGSGDHRLRIGTCGCSSSSGGLPPAAAVIASVLGLALSGGRRRAP